MDISSTIVAKSDQLNSDDLITRSITVRITKVSLLGGDQPFALSYEGDNGKPYKPGKSMRRVLVFAWGPDANKYVGRYLTLYRDAKVSFGGVAVGGIRISHMSDIKEDITMALTQTRGSKKPFTVRPLPTPDEKTLSDGKAAAEGGVKSYTDWLASLAPEVKSTIAHLHAGWSEIAKGVK